MSPLSPKNPAVLKRSKNFSPSAVRRPPLPFIVRPVSALRPLLSALHFSFFFVMGGRRTVGQGQSQEKWRAESRGRRADTGRTTKGNGGGRTADEEKFLLRFSTAALSPPLPLNEEFSIYKKLWDSLDYGKKVDKSDTKVISFAKYQIRY